MWCLFSHKANVFEIRWNSCSILSHRNPETALTEEKFQYFYSSIQKFLTSNDTAWPIYVQLSLRHSQSCSLPWQVFMNWKLYRIILIALNSAKKKSYKAWFFNTQIKIITRKKHFQCGRLKSKVSENLEPPNK